MKAGLAHGLFAAGLASAAAAAYSSRTLPPRAALSPEDAVLQRQAAAFPDATPEAAARLEDRLAAARARLPAAAGFDSWLAETGRNWIVVARSSAASGDGETRRYGLACDHPRMEAWPDIEDTIKALCAQPGVTIKRLEIVASPSDPETFQRVELALTVRLRED